MDDVDRISEIMDSLSEKLSNRTVIQFTRKMASLEELEDFIREKIETERWTHRTLHERLPATSVLRREGIQCTLLGEIL